MKTSKQKSEDLVRKNLIIISNLEIIYGNNIDFEELKLDKNFKVAIECAKIAVDEIISYIDNLEKEHMYGFGLEYWQEVKNELKKMS